MATMVTLLSRPRTPAGPDTDAPNTGAPDTGAPNAGTPLLRGWLAGIVAALWSVATLVLPLCVLGFVGWVTDRGSSSLASAVRVGAQFWVAGNGASVGTPAGHLSLHPLGVTLAVAVLLWRAGSWAGASSHVPTTWPLSRLIATFVVVYAGLVMAVAVVAATPTVTTDRWTALAGAVVLSVLAGGAGVLHGSGRMAALRRRAPAWVGVSVDAGAAATLVLVAGGAVLLAAALAFHGGKVVELTDALDAGPVGGFLLLLVGIALVPNAAIYATSYAVGPGFALGAGSSVSVAGVHLGALPALPLLGALPSGVTPPTYAYGALALPVLAGVVAGLVAIGRARGVSAEVAALRALGAGPVAGVALLALTWAASGGLGGGQLAALGPNPLLVALGTTVEVGVLAAVTAWVGCPRSSAIAAPATTTLGDVTPIAGASEGSTELAPATEQPADVASAATDDDHDTQVNLRRAL